MWRTVLGESCYLTFTTHYRSVSTDVWITRAIAHCKLHNTQKNSIKYKCEYLISFEQMHGTADWAISQPLGFQSYPESDAVIALATKHHSFCRGGNETIHPKCICWTSNAGAEKGALHTDFHLHECISKCVMSTVHLWASLQTHDKAYHWERRSTIWYCFGAE